jgi:hypothetical protein
MYTISTTSHSLASNASIIQNLTPKRLLTCAPSVRYPFFFLLTFPQEEENNFLDMFQGKSSKDSPRRKEYEVIEEEHKDAIIYVSVKCSGRFALFKDRKRMSFEVSFR